MCWVRSSASKRLGFSEFSCAQVSSGIARMSSRSAATSTGPRCRTDKVLSGLISCDGCMAVEGIVEQIQIGAIKSRHHRDQFLVEVFAIIAVRRLVDAFELDAGHADSIADAIVVGLQVFDATNEVDHQA